MNRHSIRYFFEHRLLPGGFYEEKERFIGMLLQDNEVLFRILDDLFEKEGVANPYLKESFKVGAEKLDEETMVVKIVFPKPEEEPLCYCSYLFFDKGFEKTAYFCIEKGADEMPDTPFVGAWTKDGAHLNYGKCTMENGGDFLRCAELYKQSK